MSNVVVTIPEGSHLRLVVVGEETTPVDLGPSAEALLALGLAESPQDATTDEPTVEFANVEAGDDVTFAVDGQLIDAEVALDAIGRAVVAAVRAAVDRPQDN